MKDKEVSASIMDAKLPESWVRWVAITICVAFISISVADSFESKYKAEAASAVMDAWSKAVVACIERGAENCDEAYKVNIKF